jgi:aminoglycoside phosphotransferase (APT) family kinase protein
MVHLPLEIIPADHRGAAQSALTAAFGSDPLTSLQPVTGGASGALTYRAVVAERPYLLRIETARDVFRNPQRGYACMQTASDAGIAPPLRHVDPIAGVAIMDFLPQRPLFEYPAGRTGLLRDLATLIARLQSTALFPPLIDYPTMLGRMLAMLDRSSLFSPGLLDPHVRAFERIRQIYPWSESAPVSSHNDLNPGNILYDGERLWIIDWELAFRNDPFVDVAIVAENFAQTPELEEVLLTAWLGRAPKPVDCARLVLMRQLTRLFYGSLMLSTSIGRHAQETQLPALSPAEYEAAIAQRHQVPGSPDKLHEYGKILLAAFISGLSAPGFEEALVIAQQS